MYSSDVRKGAIGKCTGTVVAARRYTAVAAAANLSSGSQQNAVGYLDEGEDDDANNHDRRYARGSESVPYPKQRPKADPKPLVEYLQRIFPPLVFPDTVATQMLTHISAKEAWAGHNARLAFVGRRVLESYLLLFLHSASQQLSRTTSPPIFPDKTFNFDLIAYRALRTHLLGELVGPQWDLARAVLWTPAVPSIGSANNHFSEAGGRLHGTPAALERPGLYKVGLYKVAGTTVQGIMGGIFHQFGGAVAQRVFHTRLLPHILCPGSPIGLHDAFHSAALEMQSRMGGSDGLLMADAPQQHTNEAQPLALSDETPRQRSASRSTEEATLMQKRRIVSSR